MSGPKEDSSAFHVYFPLGEYTKPNFDRTIISTTIDIGIKNFALRIEQRIPQIESGCLVWRIEPIYFNRIDFTQHGNTNQKDTTKVDSSILSTATDFMISVMPMISQSHLIGIERQMAINVKSLRMFQHVLTTLLIYARSWSQPCLIFDINPKLKYQMLGAPKGLNYRQGKEWTINQVIQMLTDRDDKWSLSILLQSKGRSKTKADDLADTVALMEAWFIYSYTN